MVSSLKRLKDNLFETVFNRFFRIPYRLNYRVFQSPKSPKATFVFIHGIGNTLHAWDEVVKRMPKDVRLIGVDLLGFGASPKPKWARYNAKTQARSVGMTLLGLNLSQRPIIVGHSLGALVAVEVARSFPLMLRGLVLCSPPFYSDKVAPGGLGRSRESTLKDIYRSVKKHPQQFEKLASAATKIGILNDSLTINKGNVDFYMAALESSIINQSALSDIKKLRLPISIIYGKFDPLIIKANILLASQDRPNITHKQLLVSHEIVGGYVTKLVQQLDLLIQR